jgi:ribosomal subunit interface protein
MQTQPNITYRNIDPSPVIEDHVRRRIADLEKRFDRIVGCDVVIEAPQKKKRSGRVFNVHLTIHVPGPDISASSTIAHGEAAADVNFAIHQAFDAASRQLVEYKRQRSDH